MLTGNFPVLTEMYTKCARSIFTCPIFTCFVSWPIWGHCSQVLVLFSSIPFERKFEQTERNSGGNYPPAQNQNIQETNLGELIFARVRAGPAFALTRIQETFWRDHFPHISQILEGIHFGANTCRACIRTRTNTGKYSWRIIYALVSCQGVIPPK